jgi:predicted acylesterase/phospholipase RssA
MKGSTARFDHNTFERQIKEVITGQGLDCDTPLAQTRSDACKTFVVTTSLRVGRPVLMQTYDNLPSTEAFPAFIWQAARATAAAPTFFEPIVIDEVEYGDGGTGSNNPVELAIDEAHDIWPGRVIGCVVSIGTGLEDASRLRDQTDGGRDLVRSLLNKTSAKIAFKVDVAEWCVNMLTSCENVHRRVAGRVSQLGIDNRYFRFNVPQGMYNIGLDDWDKIRDMISLAQDYMIRNGEIEKVKKLVGRILLDPTISS